MFKPFGWVRTDNASRGPDSRLTATAPPPGMSARTATPGAGLVAVLSPSARGGHRLGALNRTRARHSKQAFFAAICWVLHVPRGSAPQRHRSGGEQGPESPTAARNIRHHLGTTRCVVGSRRQNHRDALSEKTARCVVGPHQRY